MAQENDTLPLVSIVIPTFNHARYLPTAIDSCLAQTYQNIELIIVDDGSTDDTQRIVARFLQHPSVHYISQPNQGLSAARNTGIRAAHGEYVHLLDADDLLLPERIEKAMPLLTSGADFVYSDCQVRIDDLSSPFVIQPPWRAFLTDNPLQELIANRSAPFVPSAVTLRRSVCDAIGGFDESLRAAEDWHFWVKLAVQGVRFHHISEELVWYRWTPGSLSKRKLLISEQLLKAYLLVKDLPLPADIEFNRYLADRYHMLAMLSWRAGQTGKARAHFRQAMRIYHGGRLARCLLIFLSYWLSAKNAEAVFNILDHFYRTPQNIIRRAAYPTKPLDIPDATES